MVVAAKDKTVEDEEDNLLAIKKIEKAFEHRIFTKRTLRELKILRLMKHENVTHPYITSLLIDYRYRQHPAPEKPLPF